MLRCVKFFPLSVKYDAQFCTEENIAIVKVDSRFLLFVTFSPLKIE